jgi:hypothetical protein
MSEFLDLCIYFPAPSCCHSHAAFPTLRPMLCCSLPCSLPPRCIPSCIPSAHMYCAAPTPQLPAVGGAYWLLANNSGDCSTACAAYGGCVASAFTGFPRTPADMASILSSAGLSSSYCDISQVREHALAVAIFTGYSVCRGVRLTLRDRWSMAPLQRAILEVSRRLSLGCRALRGTHRQPMLADDIDQVA